ncbi:hypothetical protein GC087_06780 [Pantoea sp. JZ2]|uniref:hypothetical protein n=1 Tax=Pantoea sp. JZ2 TaxID=2654189 RepID=UPI002B4A1158|nr:hypothetical protein [Pantoea sp. JZ2]WRH12339.1 hypothetical protein GC087_06780 [Pantoea sp. JZ2]
MFSEFKSDIEHLIGVKVYPLIGPQSESEFVTMQLISDPSVETGLVRTGPIAARFQISFISSSYRRTEEMEVALWSAWRNVVHGHIGGYPVQYVEKRGISESFDPDDGGKYRRARDFIFYCPESAS